MYDPTRLDHRWGVSSPSRMAAAASMAGAAPAWRGGFERSASWRARLSAPLGWNGVGIPSAPDGVAGLGPSAEELEDAIGTSGPAVVHRMRGLSGSSTLSGRFLRGREGYGRDRVSDSSVSSTMARTHRLVGPGACSTDDDETAGEACFEVGVRGSWHGLVVWILCFSLLIFVVFSHSPTTL